MKHINLSIEYIDHSGFQVQIDNNLFIFDFFKGTPHLQDKNIYVFSSHIHPDHYNPQIFEWQMKWPNIQYILSSDICNDPSIPVKRDNVTFISPYQEISVNDFTVKAYGSTDEGVSFLVRCNELNLFHAGDLNWWHWWGDTPLNIEMAEKAFKEEISKIKGEHIDIAFFPVDPRLEHYYSIGAEYFIQEIKPKILIPMHFGENFEALKKFTKKIKNSSTEIIELTHREQLFEINIK
jgi:L-ascorbate metabolism protein UlaG (beta-lactamase superfamily)